MENITFASFIERSARSRTRFERDSQSGPAFQKFSSMGTRIRFLGWVPYQGLGTPSFPIHPSITATVINHTRGPGPASLNSGYGWTYRSIESGVPLGKGPGVLWRAGGRPAWTRAPRGGGIRRVLPGESQRSGEITRHAENAGRDSWHVAPLRRWLR